MDLDDSAELRKKMNNLKGAFEDLSVLLLSDGVVLRHHVYTIVRGQQLFSTEKVHCIKKVVKSLSTIRSSDPLNTKEAELFPGFIQIDNQHIKMVSSLIIVINNIKDNIKSFLKSTSKRTSVTTESGIIYIQNKLMFENFPMVNTLQVYRHLSADIQSIVKASLIWQSSKRYDKYNIQKAKTVVNLVKEAPCPIHMNFKPWNSDIKRALEKLDNYNPATEVTCIKHSQPKPLLKYKITDKPEWAKHYGATPLIIAEENNDIFAVINPLKDVVVENKKIILPVDNSWTVISKAAHLYIKE
jgi:hypothetical protein